MNVFYCLLKFYKKVFLRVEWSGLVQVMTWSRQAVKYWPLVVTLYGITGPKGVNFTKICTCLSAAETAICVRINSPGYGLLPIHTKTLPAEPMLTELAAQLQTSATVKTPYMFRSSCRDTCSNVVCKKSAIKVLVSWYWYLQHLGQVTKLRLSCYLFLLLIAKPGNKTAAVSWLDPSTPAAFCRYSSPRGSPTAITSRVGR